MSELKAKNNNNNQVLPETFKVEDVAPSEKTRMDVYLARKFPDYSRSFFQKMFSSGAIMINGDVVRDKNTTVKGGEVISFVIPPARGNVGDFSKTPECDITLDIIHEDEDIIVVNKQAGMVVHPACGHPDGTLTDALKVYSKNAWQPYLAHRLDKDTTGVIIAAKNMRARDILARQFKSRHVRKVYIAIVKGIVNFKKASIDAPLGRKPSNRFIVSVGEGAKMRESYTEAEKILDGKGWSALIVRPQTGRTHQIRAHFAFIKHPILGDAMYGGSPSDDIARATRPLLHAYSITFRHPRDGREVGYTAPLPEDMLSVAPGLGQIFDRGLSI